MYLQAWSWSWARHTHLPWRLCLREWALRTSPAFTTPKGTAGTLTIRSKHLLAEGTRSEVGEVRETCYWHLSFIWFQLRNRILDFGSDSSGGARRTIQKSLRNQSVLLHSCCLAFPILGTLSLLPSCLHFSQLPLGLPLSCPLWAALSSCNGEWHYLGFPSFLFCSSPFSAVCGVGEKVEPLYSEKKFTILRLETALRDGPSCHGTRWLPLWDLNRVIHLKGFLLALWSSFLLLGRI